MYYFVFGVPIHVVFPPSTLSLALFLCIQNVLHLCAILYLVSLSMFYFYLLCLCVRLLHCFYFFKNVLLYMLFCIQYSYSYLCPIPALILAHFCISYRVPVSSKMSFILVYVLFFAWCGYSCRISACNFVLVFCLLSCSDVFKNVLLFIYYFGFGAPSCVLFVSSVVSLCLVSCLAPMISKCSLFMYFLMSLFMSCFCP